MVRGRNNRITRTVGLALAALFTLAAPLASSEVQAAESTAKADTAQAERAPEKAAKASPKKAKKRGKTAKHDAKSTHAKKSATPAKSVETTTVSTTHAGDAAVVHAKHAPSKTNAATVKTSTATSKKAPTTATKKDKPHATHKAPKAAAETTSSTHAATTSKRASTRTPGAKRKTGKKPDGDSERPPCQPTSISIDRNGLENETFALLDCKGKPLDAAREKLSVLARPWGTPRPVIEPPKKVKKPSKRAGGKDKPGDAVADNGEIAPNVRLLDPGLLTRIDTISKHFPGKHISVVSGYRPRSRGSLHQSARAIDLRVTGASNEEVVAFCKTITDTGCGYYPNSSFVHVDVRAPGTGSVTWIDASGPGEAPRYVAAWPPPPEQKAPDADVHDGATPEGIEDEVMREATRPASSTSGTTSTSTTVPAMETTPKVTKEADPKDPVRGTSPNPGPAKPDATPKEPAASPATRTAAPAAARAN